MLLRLRLAVVAGVIAITAFGAPGVLAQSTTYGLDETVAATSLPRGANPIQTAARIVNVVLGFLGVILVVLMLYAGFLWMTASGNEERITKAKGILRSSIIGLIIVLTAYGISVFVVTQVKSATSSRSSTSAGTCPGRCTTSIACTNHSNNPYNCTGGTPVCCLD